MIWSRAFVAAGILLSAGAPCASQDSLHLATGGIVLGRYDSIEIRAQELFISTQEIRVTYRLLNRSDKDITTLVAFPMPDIAVPIDGEDLSIPVQDPVNFLGFKAQVDAAPIELQTEQRALAVGIDRTDLLKSLGIPLAPHLETTATAVRALPAERQAELLAMGVLRNEERDLGQGARQSVQPNWTLRSDYFWTQLFPAKKEVVIEHQYKPSVGSSPGTSIGNRLADPDTVENYRERYCVERPLILAAQQALKALEPNGSLVERRIEYILVAGANWEGPVRDFRAVIDTGVAGHLMSVCGNMRRIAPTQFEFRQPNFWLEGSLEVLFLEPSQ